MQEKKDKTVKILDTLTEPYKAQIIREVSELLQAEREKRQKEESERNKRLDSLIGKI